MNLFLDNLAHAPYNMTCPFHSYVVGVAQSAERQVVVLEVMGSIPIIHPISRNRLIEVGS